jgi:hypothetical protein
MTRNELVLVVAAAVVAGCTSPTAVLTRLGVIGVTHRDDARLDLGHVRDALDCAAARGLVVLTMGRKGTWTGARVGTVQP